MSKKIIRGGTIVTAVDTVVADVLIDGETIAGIGSFDGVDAQVIDAGGASCCLGASTCTRISTCLSAAQSRATTSRPGPGRRPSDGTTACRRLRHSRATGQSLADTLAVWQAKATGKAVIDYGFHVAVTDLTDDVLAEIPRMVEAGVPSFKLFMAYKGALMVDDATLLRTLKKAKEAGALISVHAENGDVVDVLVKEYLAAGKGAPRYHALSRPPEAEGEATGRAIFLAGLAGAPIYIVHLTCKDALDKVRAARDRGLPVYAETCPQYLALSIDNYDEPGFEGAKYVCSPPLRDRANWDELWAGIAAGDLQVVATDHCPFNFVGQKDMGRDDFSKIPNGAPGIEHRLLLLWEHGVKSGRMTPNRFVEVTSTAIAKIFGLYPSKGTIAPGADADIVIFDPNREHVFSTATSFMNVDYDLWDGQKVRARRGRR